jgi:hypothetical protein
LINARDCGEDNGGTLVKKRCQRNHGDFTITMKSSDIACFTFPAWNMTARNYLIG